MPTRLAMFRPVSDRPVVDVLLPGMSGREFAERLRQINPDTVVLPHLGLHRRHPPPAFPASVPFLPSLHWTSHRRCVLPMSARATLDGSPLATSVVPSRGPVPPVGDGPNSQSSSFPGNRAGLAVT